MEPIFEALKEGGPACMALAVGWLIFILALLTVAIWAIVALTRKSTGPGPGLFRWSILLSVLGAAFVFAVLVIGVHEARALRLEGISNLDAMKMAVSFAKGLSQVLNQGALAGSVLISLAFLCALGLFLSWSIRSVREKTSVLLPMAILCLPLASGLMGSAIMNKEIYLVRAYSAVSFADAQEKAMLISKAYEAAPGADSQIILMWVALGFAAVAFLFWFLRSKPQVVHGRWILLLGGMTFLMGLGAFAATRWHVLDNQALPGLLARLGNMQIFTFPEEDVRPVALKNTTPLETWTTLVVGESQVKIGGKKIATIEEILKSPEGAMSDLSEHFVNIRRNYQQLHPTKSFDGRLIFQVDREAPMSAMAVLLKTCAKNGYKNIQLAAESTQMISSAVLGEVPVYSSSGLSFLLVEDADPSALQLPLDQTYEQWAASIDSQSAQGAVRVTVGK